MRAELASWPAATQIQLPFQFALRTVARGFHLVANSGSHAVAQRGVQPNQFFLALRTKVHFQSRLMRYRIDRSSAFNLSQVECGARISGHSCVDEANRAANQRVDCIGNAEIGPTVPSRSVDDNLDTPRSQSLGRDVVNARPIHYDHRFQPLAIGIYTRA